MQKRRFYCIIVHMKLSKKKQDVSPYVKTRYKVGLALSGGGTRGLAHVGVIKAFAEERIRIDFVAGTSAGALVGACFCAGVSCEKMTEEAKTLKRKDVLNSKFMIGSDSANIRAVADKLLQGADFNQLAIPFSAVAVDIKSGNEIILNDGDVATAVSASCAVPALFTPVPLGEWLLVDGGLLNNMPADVCRRMGADVVIGVDLNHNRGKGTASRKLKDTLIATWNITTKSTMYKGEINSDAVIEPELSEYKNTSLERIDDMVEEGYRAAKAKMGEIKEILQIR